MTDADLKVLNTFKNLRSLNIQTTTRVTGVGFADLKTSETSDTCTPALPV